MIKKGGAKISLSFFIINKIHFLDHLHNKHKLQMISRSWLLQIQRKFLIRKGQGLFLSHTPIDHSFSCILQSSQTSFPIHMDYYIVWCNLSSSRFRQTSLHQRSMFWGNRIYRPAPSHQRKRYRLTRCEFSLFNAHCLSIK